MREPRRSTVGWLVRRQAVVLAALAALLVGTLLVATACDPDTTASDDGPTVANVRHEPDGAASDCGAVAAVGQVQLTASFSSPEWLVDAYLRALQTADVELLRNCLLPSDRKRYGSREALAAVFGPGVREAAAMMRGVHAYPLLADLRAEVLIPRDAQWATGLIARAREGARSVRAAATRLAAVNSVAIFQLSTAEARPSDDSAHAGLGSSASRAWLLLRRIGDRWYVRLYPELDATLTPELRARFDLPAAVDVRTQPAVRPVIEPGSVIPNRFWRPIDPDGDENTFGPLQPPPREPRENAGD